MNFYLDALKKYAVFSGRSTRQEFWMFTLINLLISIAISVIATIIKVPIISSLYSLAVMLPAIGIGVRRLHDINKSGWWCLLPFVNIYFWCLPATEGENKFDDK
ncbi:MAG: DUF805 domain-containing protein [Desulfobacterales bacterium]|nr:DUF805 domain-containing protein [Desulfobacterales bacterium]MCP4162898.1 DUF805 domain-containing protein [Deltaproteobacteria bacterium]